MMNRHKEAELPYPDNSSASHSPFVGLTDRYSDTSCFDTLPNADDTSPGWSKWVDKDIYGWEIK